MVLLGKPLAIANDASRLGLSLEKSELPFAFGGKLGLHPSTREFGANVISHSDECVAFAPSLLLGYRLCSSVIRTGVTTVRITQFTPK